MSNSSGTTTVTVGGETFEITITKVTNNNNSNKNSNVYEKQRDIVYDNESNQEGGKAKKAKKKGTRKLSKYMIFCQKERDKLLKERPELKSDIPGIGRALGERWRALSDSEKASL